MPLDATANFVRGETDSSLTNSDTTVSVNDASIFPDPATEGEYNVVIWDVADHPRPDQDPDVEVLRVTAIDTTNDNLTVNRGQETTTGASHPLGSAVHLAPTAKMFGDIEATFNEFYDDSAQELTADVNTDSVSTDVLSNVSIAHGSWSDVKTTIENAGSEEVVMVLSADGDSGYTADQQIQISDAFRLNVIFNSPQIDIQTNDPVFLLNGANNVTFSGSVAVRHSSSETGSFIKGFGSRRMNFASLAINAWRTNGNVYEFERDGTDTSVGPYITGPVTAYKPQATPVRLYSNGSKGQTSHAAIIGPVTCSQDLDGENGESAVELINVADVIIPSVMATVGGEGIRIEGPAESIYMGQLDVASLTAESLKITDNADGLPSRIFANQALFGPDGVRDIDIKAEEVWFNSITSYSAPKDGVLIRDGSDRIHILGGQVRDANDGNNADTFGINIEDGGTKRVVIKDVHFRDSSATAHIHWGDGSREKGVMRDCDLDGSADNYARNLPRYVSGLEGLQTTSYSIETGFPTDTTGDQNYEINTGVDVDPNREDIDGELQYLSDKSVDFANGPYFTESDSSDCVIRYNISSAGAADSTLQAHVIIEHNSPKVGDV